MNKPLLIGFVIVVLVVIAGLPLLSGLKKEMAGSEATPATASAPAAPASPAAASGPPVSPASLENTTWQINTDQGMVSVSLLPGGRVLATPPPNLAGMIKTMTGKDTLDGTWSISGNQLTASVSAMGRTTTIAADVVNGQIVYKGQPAVRVQ